MLDENDYRILSHMQRAPTGHYTSAQLARNTGVPLAEVQRRLALLEDAGYVLRSTATPYPAFHLAEQGRLVPPQRQVSRLLGSLRAAL
jgi:DNA-binding IclR family transcriptional regulator